MKINAKYGIVAALTLAAFVAPSVSAYTYKGGEYTFSNSEKAYVGNCVRDILGADKLVDEKNAGDYITATTEYDTDIVDEAGKIEISDSEDVVWTFDYIDETTKASASEAAAAKIIELQKAEVMATYNSHVDTCVRNLTDAAKIFDDTIEDSPAAGDTAGLEAAVKTAESNIKTAEKAVTTTERAVTKAKTAVSRAQAKYDKAVADAKVRYPEYTDDEIESVSAVSSAKTALDNAQTNLEAAQLDLDNAKDSLVTTKDDKAEAAQKLADNKAEIAADELEYAEDKLEKAQERLDAKKDDLDVAKENLADAQADYEEAKIDTANAKADLKGVKETDPDYERLSQAKADAEEKEAAAKARVESAKTSVSNAERAVKIEEKKVAAAEKLVATKKAAADKAEEEAKISIASATISGIAKAYTYKGSAIKPAVTAVKLGDTVLTAGTDYTVSYGKNVEVGTATVTIKGTGTYSGSITKTFYIDPAKSSVKKVSVGAKKMTVTVKKGTKATGVQIGYRVKGASKWSYAKTTSTSKTIKSLKKGKKYQIMVRSYTSKSGKITNYSGWSSAKNSAKIK